jgi:hypothetical protein
MLDLADMIDALVDVRNGTLSGLYEGAFEAVNLVYDLKFAAEKCDLLRLIS